MRKAPLLTLFSILSLLGFSQSISGTITDEENNTLPSVNIAILNTSIGATSLNDGSYKMAVPANKSILVAYSFIGYEIEKIRLPMLKRGQNYTLNIQLKAKNTLLNDVIVKDKKSRKESFNRIKPKHGLHINIQHLQSSLGFKFLSFFLILLIY